MFKKRFIKQTHFGLRFERGEFRELLPPGTYTFFAPLNRTRVDVADAQAPHLKHDQLREIVRSGALRDIAVVVDLSQHQRAIVRVDDRLHSVLPPGLYAFFTTHRTVDVEVIDARTVRLQRDDLVALRTLTGSQHLQFVSVPPEMVAVLRTNGITTDVLPAGEYAFWKQELAVDHELIDLREQVIDVAGQEILTADNVSLRVNAVIALTVSDPRKVVEVTADVNGAVYRETQLALRAAVGGRTLDQLLEDKQTVGREVAEAVVPRATEIGVSVVTAGIKDLILPGEMKALMNRVTEARKAAEADQIRRKEETQAVRSQANTARVLENNPTLMRLRELEVLETIAKQSKLEVLLGGEGLRSQVTKML